LCHVQTPFTETTTKIETPLERVPRKRIRVTPTIEAPSPTPVIDLCEDENEFFNDNENDEGSEAAGSEGGDDFHCTQIIDEENDDNANEGVNNDEDPCQEEPETCMLGGKDESSKELTLPEQPPSAPKEQQPAQQASINNPKNDNDNDVCFICGTSLSKLKRRLDHIKRCSKKHSITGRDVKLNDDHETYTKQKEKPSATNNNNNNNPYTKETSWHGDATLALRLAEQDTASSSTNNQCTTTTRKNNHAKQTSLTSFLQVPVRSVNNVLIAGARRISKVKEVVALKKSNNKEPNAQGGSERGGWMNRRDYSKVSPHLQQQHGSIVIFLPTPTLIFFAAQLSHVQTHHRHRLCV
jgi:hypothetical protein